VKNRISKSENRKPGVAPSDRHGQWTGRPVFVFRFSICVFAALFQISCAAPAEPQPRHPVIPARITDLAAVERGDAALLTFTPPAKSTEGKPLAARPDVEILRAFGPLGAKAPAAGALDVVATLPGAVLETHVESGHVVFRDHLPPEEIARHDGAPVFYAVRARVSKRAASEDSNVASFLAHPGPSPVEELHATVVEAGVQLDWAAPTTATGGAPLASLAGFRVYRAEPAPAPAGSARSNEPVFLANAPTLAFLDTQIEWGRTYIYTVRSVAQYGADSVESADSPPVQVTPKDIFPPAPPLDLVAVYVPAAGAAPAAVELSWAISPEPDAAGYYLYRSSEGEAKAQRITPALLPTPAFRDISLVLGARYTYTVTAVDRAGNESPPSAPVSVSIPKAGE